MKRGKTLAPVGPSPVDVALKSGPRGDGNWPGFSVVWSRIQRGCHNMARNPQIHLSQDHVDSMGDLGSGHEERMKGRIQWMMTYGYLTAKDLSDTRNTSNQ